MGKSKQNKDFQKVKFKVGKKIAKNTNDTKATFKTKTLVLKQQFKEEKLSIGLIPHRNIVLKDVFSQMNHNNQNIKLDALNKLKDEIGKSATGSDILRHELSHIVEHLCPLFTDKDYKVREASIEMLKTLIVNPQVAKSNSLEPFFHLISVHLCCAMTHIVEKIQYSSLKLLDILIEFKPDFVRAFAMKIFDNFVEQISKSDLKGTRRILKNDPLKFTSTHSWRRNVLARLTKMLSIVAAGIRSANSEADESDLVESSAFIELDNSKQCFLSVKYCNQKPNMLDLNKKTSTDSKEALKKHISVIIPLLADCWIEAKPENNSNVIDDPESLSVMHSVLSIYDIMIENLGIDITEFTKHLHVPKHHERKKYFEYLFLSNFPFILSDNFDYSDSNKSDNQKNLQQITSRSINLLLCKIFASSLLSIEEENLLQVFEYCLNIFKQTSNTTTTSISKSELQSTLKIYNIILKEFSNPDLIGPFLNSLISFYEHSQNSTQKWLLFQTLSKNFLDNENINKYESIHLMFFKKSLVLLISLLKERSEKSELLIDWIRCTLVQKQKRQKLFSQLFNDQYINILSVVDFEATNMSDSCKKKIIELIAWLPKISQLLLAKLAILILNKNVWFFCKTQITEILKLKVDMNDNSCLDHSDYLVFIMNLINGYLSFDLLNKNTTGNERLIIDLAKFEQHKKLCDYLKSFISSHKNHQELVDLLISTSIPTFLTRMTDIYSSTLYGNLCLLSLLSPEKTRTNPIYEYILSWIENTFNWTLEKQISLANTNQFRVDSDETKYTEKQCINDLFNKFFGIFETNVVILNDFMSRVTMKARFSNDVEDLRKKVVLMSFMLKKYSNSLKTSQQAFINLVNFFQSLNEFAWMQEFSILVQHL